MLTTISWIALAIGIICTIMMAIDVIRHPQMMKIMNIAWPINGWFFGLLLCGRITSGGV